MKRWIERALNIHPGDLGRGALLSSCLFLVITAYVTGKVAGAALFLAHFQAKQLAWADISSSVLVAIVVVDDHQSPVGIVDSQDLTKLKLL